MPKVRRNYSEECLQKALEAIKNKEMSKKAASKFFNIPRATLIFRLGPKFTKVRPGPQTILSKIEEDVIEDWIISSQKKGFPKRKEDVLNSVNEFLEQDKRDHPFGSDNMPGNGWFRAFLARHPSISLRTPDPVTSASAAVSASDIKSWFTSIQNFLEESNCFDILEDPTRIFNGDETNFLLCPKTKNVLAAKGARNIYEVDRGLAKANLTVMFTFGAVGIMVPPMIIYPYKRIPDDIRKSVPKDWGLGVSDNGWMTKEVFYEYISKVFHPHLIKIGTKFPIVFFVDGHTTHQTLAVSKLCVQLGIILIALYPNATRILQPADVSAFKPLKNTWNKQVVEWRRQNPGESLTKYKFAPMLVKVIDTSFNQEIIKHGFRACGIFPFNCNAIDYSRCLGKNNNYVPVLEPIRKADKQVSYYTFSQLLGSDKLKEFEEASNGLCSAVNWSDDSWILYKMFLEFQPDDFISKIRGKSSVSTNYSEAEILSFNNFVDSPNVATDIHSIDEFLYINEDIVMEESVANVEVTETSIAEATPLKVASILEDFLDWPITPARQGIKPVKAKKPYVITDPLWIRAEQLKKEEKQKEIIIKEQNKLKRLENKNKKIKDKTMSKSKISRKGSKNIVPPKLVKTSLQDLPSNLKENDNAPKIRPAASNVEYQNSFGSSHGQVLHSTDNFCDNIESSSPKLNKSHVKNLFKEETEENNNLQENDIVPKIRPAVSNVEYQNSLSRSHGQVLHSTDKFCDNIIESSSPKPNKAHVKNLFEETENFQDIGQNRIAVGVMCYKCTYSLKNKLGIKCGKCTREYHINCIQQMNLAYMPKFLCNSCK